MRVLVTGANGFVGKALCRKLVDEGYGVRGAVRSEKSALPSGVEKIVVGDIDGNTDWSSALEGIDCVIHLAARVHVMRDESADPLSEFRKVNVEGTRKLAESAAAAGVRRLVYASSIKVNGEGTRSKPYTEDDRPNPQDPYGISKWEAEKILHDISAETGLEVVIIRPPLVYGPEVGGNFIRMLQWIAKGIPLPLDSVDNRRNLIYVGNLANALMLCSVHPEAKGKTFLVSDTESISTPELIRRIASTMHISPRLFGFPVSALGLLGKITGKSAEFSRLAGSLEIDSSRIRGQLGWTPPFTLEEGLTETIGWFSGK